MRYQYGGVTRNDTLREKCGVPGPNEHEVKDWIHNNLGVRFFAGEAALSPFPAGKRYDATRAAADLRQRARIEDLIYAKSARMWLPTFSSWEPRNG